MFHSWDEEAMDAEAYRKATMHDKALALLAPASADETLIGAVNNLRQVARTAKDNADELEQRLKRCLRMMREVQRGSYFADIFADDFARVIAECSVGIDLDDSEDA